jgi:hypothetical protein
LHKHFDLISTVNLVLSCNAIHRLLFMPSLNELDSGLRHVLRKKVPTRNTADAFDLKSCIGHLRSFYEHVHIQSAARFAAQKQESVKNEFDPSVTLLKNDGTLTWQQERFARGLYTLLSTEGVHSLISEREFARMLRNMVIEYHLMFLSILDKQSFKVRDASSHREGYAQT